MAVPIYFTLHAEDEKGPVVYKSEVVRNTLNPSWKAFNYQQDFLVEIPPKCSKIVLKVYRSDKEEGFIFEKIIDLIDVTFIASHISFLLSCPPNSLIIKLIDGYYTSEDVSISTAVPDPLDFEAKPLSLQHANVMLNRTSSFSDACKAFLGDATKLQEKVSQALVQRSRNIEQRRLLEIQEARVMKLRQEYANMSQLVSEARKQNSETKEHIHTCTKKLYESSCQLMTKKHLLKQERETLIEERIHLDRIKFSLSKRRTYLISQLRSILPITKSSDGKTYKILNLRIPNGEFSGLDEEIEAAALGYACLLANTLSKYLEIPLRYPMKFMGSRSLIYDVISNQTSSEFQLYLKGADLQRYEYAIYLLSRNIEQLMNSQSYNVSKLRYILPNIQTLLASDNVGGSDFDRLIHRWPGVMGTPPGQTTPPTTSVGSGPTSTVSPRQSQVQSSGRSATGTSSKAAVSPLLGASTSLTGFS